MLAKEAISRMSGDISLPVMHSQIEIHLLTYFTKERHYQRDQSVNELIYTYNLIPVVSCSIGNSRKLSLCRRYNIWLHLWHTFINSKEHFFLYAHTIMLLLLLNTYRTSLLAHLQFFLPSVSSQLRIFNVLHHQILLSKLKSVFHFVCGFVIYFIAEPRNLDLNSSQSIAWFNLCT